MSMIQRHRTSPVIHFQRRHSMTTAINPIICAEDPLIDMVYITTYTGMTDKWF
jgi:hypothetical protein